MLLVGWKTLLNREALDADPIAEMERLYKAINAQCDETKPSFNPEVRARARQELVKLQGGDEENLTIWREMLRLSQVQFETIYGRLGVKFDFTLGESFYNPWLKEVAAELGEKGIARESEGALCVFSDGTVPEKEDPFVIQRDGQWVPQPALVLKEDGAANYTTTDLATLQYRIKEWNPDEIVYITDGRQQLHFRQLFAIFRRWHPELSAKVRLAHVWFGSILGPDNKPLKTRSGENVKLSELLDEAEERALKIVTEKNPELPESERKEIARVIGIGAVKYADLLPNRQTDYVFSWDKMLSLQGNTAPYLLYSYVRIRSIFRKAEDAGIARNQWEGSKARLTEPAEVALGKKLLQFGEVVPQVLEEYRPNILCNYLFELASAFHTFFEACPVIKSEGPTRGSRLVLCETAARVLRCGLGLLGIEVPERM
jgi:arginyl-tRNA synthetase